MKREDTYREIFMLQCFFGCNSSARVKCQKPEKTNKYQKLAEFITVMRISCAISSDFYYEFACSVAVITSALNAGDRVLAGER